MLIITSYLQIVIQITYTTILKFKLSKSQNPMQLIQQIDTKLTQNIPYYQEIYSFTTEQLKNSYDSINNIYQYSTNKVKKVSKASNQLKKDLIWMISQSTQDFLEFIEQKLEMECPESDEKNKTKRAINIFNQLKNQKLIIYINQLITFNKQMLSKGKLYGQKHFIPIYVQVKATLLVSKQLLMEILAERLGQLRMTYKCHKDTITMYWSGQFKEEKVIERIKQNLGNFKQFTISFVQKGLEIKISKTDLIENYHNIMNMLTQVLKGVSEKSIEQWTQTKTKTANLYTSVLERIKAKQTQIRIKMIKLQPSQRTEPTCQQKDEAKLNDLELKQVSQPESQPTSTEN